LRTIDGLRADITARILKALPNPEGGVAAALLTGEQTARDQGGHPGECVIRVWRTSSRSPVFHIVFVVALVMGFVRYGIALNSAAGAQDRRQRRSQAVIALAGRAVSTRHWRARRCRRSAPAAMAAFALLAILLDRAALSLRLVAWSAVVVLVAAPDALVGASFQMSFAAVIALIAAWEMGNGWRRRLPRECRAVEASSLWRITTAVGASLATS